MEEKNAVEIKRDELGIIPVGVKEKITLDIRNFIVNSDLSNIENKKRFNALVKSNPELIDILSKVAFNTLVKKVANECDEFNTSEYLIDKYELDSKSLEVDDNFWSLASGIVQSYLDLNKLLSKYENYETTLENEQNLLEEKIDKLYLEEKDGEAEKYEARTTELKYEAYELEDFFSDPYSYSDGIVDKYIDKLEYYILNNADLYVNTNELFERLVKDIQTDSPSTARLYLDTIKEFAKKYQANNSIVDENVESLEPGKKVK